MGFFITFEGIEGCGKTTQVRLLGELLESCGKRVVVTREPGGCPLADKIRAILLDADNREMVANAELMLYAASRAQHVAQVIRPALEAGAVVLCDRFCDATVVYQGYGRGIDLSVITGLNEMACQGIKPDLTLLMDCDISTGLGRARQRIESVSGPREERMELESLAFHQRVRDGYLAIAASDPGRVRILDADQSIEVLSRTVAEHVMRCLEK